MGVDAAGNKDEGAGDQGIMFGYATNETPELMPATLQYSHNILKVLADARHSGKEPGLEPDAKSQVTLQYENGKPVRATSIVLSTQHKEGLTSKDVEAIVKPYILKVLPAALHRREHRMARQPDRQFRDRRPGRRLRPDRPQDHRRHLWRRGARMAAAPSPARTRPRSTVRPPMPAAIWRRTSSRRAWRIAARSRSAMRSASSKPLSFYVDLHDTGRVDPAKLEKALPEMIGGCTPRAIREHLEPEQADLCAHRRLRPFRPQAGQGRRLLLGKDRPRRSAQELFGLRRQQRRTEQGRLSRAALFVARASSDQSTPD